MKKALLFAGFAGVLLGAAALVAVAQDQQSSGRRGSRNREGRGGGGPRPEFTDPLAEVRGEDGSLNLEGLMAKLSEGLKAADKDADGVLTAEELRASDFGRFFMRGPFGPGGMMGGPGGPRPDGQRGPGGPGGPGGQRGPGGPGGMMGGPMRYMFQAMVVDLSKLPEDTPDDVRETFTKADKNGDGFLDGEERMAMMPRPEGPGGDNARSGGDNAGSGGDNARSGRRGSRSRGN